MQLNEIPGDFCVCKVTCIQQVNFAHAYVFLGKTEDEISVVCPVQAAPPSTLAMETGWKMLQVDGQLNFGMTGVIAGISGVLASQSIPLFVVSTYNTDYVLLKAEWYEKALQALQTAGYTIQPGAPA